MTRPDDIPKDVWEAADGPAGHIYDPVNPAHEYVRGIIARAILAAEQRGEQRQRERIAKRYDAAADEFDKQAIETMSVADKLRLDTLAANHRQFAAAIRNQEQSNG